MERSSFSRVETTHDHEKRLAVKAKLAKKIAESEQGRGEPGKPLAPTSFNGVEIGGKIFHPSLGIGTLIKFDEGHNEVLIDFGQAGLIPLIMSQAKSVLRAPAESSESGIIYEPFIGGEIQRDLPSRPDVAHRQINHDKIISPDFIEPKKTFLSEGSYVWHPDLGNCQVFSVDERANSLVLRVVNQDVEVDLVLSQVRSKLTEITSAPEHVPVKPMVKETLAKRVPAYEAPREVNVSLPEAFKSWSNSAKFHYLTNNQHLTTEAANDVFSVLEGNKPSEFSVTVSWEPQVTSEPQKAPQALSPKIERQDLSGWIGKQVWHPDFGTSTVFSIEDGVLILSTSVGHVPFVLDVALPKLVPMEEGIQVAHAPKRIKDLGLKGRS